jgi:hypothetical protein
MFAPLIVLGVSTMLTVKPLGISGMTVAEPHRPHIVLGCPNSLASAFLPQNDAPVKMLSIATSLRALSGSPDRRGAQAHDDPEPAVARR